MRSSWKATCETPQPYRRLGASPSRVGTGVTVEAADYRIEQLLDKIIDNALDFALPDTAIAVALRRERSDAVLTIRNQGPLLSEDTRASMFDSMVTRRDGTTIPSSILAWAFTWFG